MVKSEVDADSDKKMQEDAKPAAETPVGANATDSGEAIDLVQDAVGGSVGEFGSGGSTTAEAPQTPTSSAKKQAASRAKKAKDGTPSGSKKAAASPAASGLRGISSFLVRNAALPSLLSF